MRLCHLCSCISGGYGFLPQVLHSFFVHSPHLSDSHASCIAHGIG